MVNRYRYPPMRGEILNTIEAHGRVTLAVLNSGFNR